MKMLLPLAYARRSPLESELRGVGSPRWVEGNAARTASTGVLEPKLAGAGLAYQLLWTSSLIREKAEKAGYTEYLALESMCSAGVEESWLHGLVDVCQQKVSI